MNLKENSNVKIIPLGGLEQIGMNMSAFMYEDSIIVVDCGLAFPEDDMLGIDLVIPDVTYLKDNIDKVKGNNFYDLLSLVLSKSISNIIKKGIYKEYEPCYEETPSLRGKINFDDSLKRNSFKKGKTFCHFDEFSDDVIHNQILKYTMYNILKSKDICKNIKAPQIGLLSDVLKTILYEAIIYNNFVGVIHFFDGLRWPFCAVWC